MHSTWHLLAATHLKPQSKVQCDSSCKQRLTHNAILHTETKLELEIRSLDEDSGDRRAAHNAQLYLQLILQALDSVQKPTLMLQSFLKMRVVNFVLLIVKTTNEFILQVSITYYISTVLGVKKTLQFLLIQSHIHHPADY